VRVPTFTMGQEAAWRLAAAEVPSGPDKKERTVERALRIYGLSVREAYLQMREVPEEQRHTGRIWFKAAAKGRFNVGPKRRVNIWNTGAKHHNTFLTKAQVLEIYSYRDQRKGTSVARMFGISPSHVYSIWRGKTWAWLTNAKRTRKKGFAKGERNGNVRLTVEDVQEIAQRVANAETTKAIAEAFEVTEWCIQKIRYGYSWTHVTGLPKKVVSRKAKVVDSDSS